jgi:hypothetical protein
MPERVYVRVSSDFDPTGYMRPRAITWPDGRVYRIDGIRSFRPSEPGGLLDCYTVLIGARERSLYFERSSNRFSGRLGRWFVESN